MAPPATTLSRRGAQLAAGPNARVEYSAKLNNLFDADTNPDGFCNLGVAENYAMLPTVSDFVNERIKFARDDFTYGEGPWGTKRLRTAMARFMTKQFKAMRPVDPDNLQFASGVTSVLEMLGFVIAEEGDAVLVPRPIYHSFKFDFGIRAGVKMVYADFDGLDQFRPEAVCKFEEAIVKSERSGTKVRAMVLCNPNNPLGQCYPKETIVALLELCQKYKIHVLSDEVYATSVYEVAGDERAVPFTSVLSFDTTPHIDDGYLHVLYSFSKDFGSGGLRLGLIHTKNAELDRALAMLCHFHWTGPPQQRMATVLVEDEAWVERYLEQARGRLSQLNRYTRGVLERAGIAYHRGANAGFFLWVDLSPYLEHRSGGDGGEDEQDDEAVGWAAEKRLLDKMVEQRVFLTNGQELAAQSPGWFRLIFAHDERTLKEGFRRLFRALGREDLVASALDEISSSH